MCVTEVKKNNTLVELISGLSKGMVRDSFKHFFMTGQEGKTASSASCPDKGI